MPQKKELNYRDLRTWVKRIKSDLQILDSLVDTWSELVGSDIEELSFSENTEDLTKLLITCCDHHPTARIDSAPLARFNRLLTYLDIDHPLVPKPGRDELFRSVQECLDVLLRLKLAFWASKGGGYTKDDLLELDSTDKMILKCIQEDDGILGKNIAYKIGIIETQVRSRISKKLKSLGVYNQRDSMGYHFRKPAGS